MPDGFLLIEKCVILAKFFLFFYVYIESPNPQTKPQKAPHHRLQAISTENPNANNPIQDTDPQNPNPQTTMNEQNWEKKYKD